MTRAISEHLKASITATIVALSIFIAGCSTAPLTKTARYPDACRIGINEASIQGGAYWLFGTLSQQGLCAPLPELSVELGFYYWTKKDTIAFDLDVDHGLNGSPAGLLYNLALVSGCREEGVDLFIVRLHENKIGIFGPEKENWPRTVMLKIEDMIESDPELVKLCR
ncbi:hypothetical protein [Bdellovibrio svalbardensis]|uniref:Uncharacterized protein n=1 Tax=Bdellovibrio svalbardensis TaxID=2972972 RepID=A0ABT6DHV8_9BACT|nr:hypothetical protein [Bdellovibrio svalbardensis]MDG0816442.1 hypothetical protein [Bdellovibrio svalbardensis]